MVNFKAARTRETAVAQLREWIELGRAKQTDSSIKRPNTVDPVGNVIAQGFVRLTQDERLSLMEVLPVITVSWRRHLSHALSRTSASGLADWLAVYWADAPLLANAKVQDNWVRLATVGGRSHDAAATVARLNRYSSVSGLQPKLLTILEDYALDKTLADWLDEAMRCGISREQGLLSDGQGLSIFSPQVFPVIETYGLVALLVAMNDDRYLSTIADVARVFYDEAVYLRRFKTSTPEWMTSAISTLIRTQSSTTKAGRVADTLDCWRAAFPNG